MNFYKNMKHLIQRINEHRSFESIQTILQSTNERKR